ncbi:hypothetical protein E1B28_007030 [Marasmius oreades]|uniref:Uncharacterized protein n=1 Tax=Marasmius oreades TaxID=181124 RepID=A0A9P7UVH6_9AGAR|nr:uncharacterized protein E1B28_007030 [Marasmius oreades]KAG7093349.1 hypothetical protein E1B28_007030 [Marasmius oreades]
MPLCSHRFPLPGSPQTVQGRATGFKELPYPRWLHFIYMLLILAAFGMSVLEIVRLAMADMGVGFLPLSSAGLFLVLNIMWQERKARTREMLMVLTAYWLFMAAAETVKIVRLHTLDQILSDAIEDRNLYPSSVQILDNAVLLGLYVLFLCFEPITLFLSLRTKPPSFELCPLAEPDPFQVPKLLA